MADTESRMFPGNKIDALTMLYLQNQDLTSCSPEALVQAYIDVRLRITVAFREKQDSY